MKYVFIVFMCVFLSSCTIQFKGKDVEFDARPIEPGLKMSNHTYELESIAFLKDGG